MSRTSSSHYITQHSPKKHGGKLAFASKCKESQLLDFSTNTTPLGASTAILQALKKNTNRDISAYPDPLSHKLIAELSKYIHIPQSNIIAGNGAIEIIYNTIFAFANTGQILIQSPTFQEYESASRLYYENAPSRMIHFESMNMALDLDAFIKKINMPACTGMIFLCNPNNPTGKMLSQNKVLKIINAAATTNSKKHPCHIIIDECFIEMSKNPRASVISHVSKYDNLIVLRSMTKSFGLPGIRLGYAAANHNIIDTLYRIKLPWSVNNIAETAGIAALKYNPKKILAKTRHTIQTETAYMQKRLSSINGIYNYDTDANFILLKTRLNSTALQAKLAKKNKILVRDCSDFRGMPDNNNHIRVAIKKHKENVLLINALEDAMKQ